jgi:hypothetical protein
MQKSLLKSSYILRRMAHKPPDLKDTTVAELKTVLTLKSIPFSSGMKKKDLFDLLYLGKAPPQKSLTVREIKEKLKGYGVDFPSSLTKDELLVLLEDATVKNLPRKGIFEGDIEEMLEVLGLEIDPFTVGEGLKVLNTYAREKGFQYVIVEKKPRVLPPLCPIEDSKQYTISDLFSILSVFEENMQPGERKDSTREELVIEINEWYQDRFLVKVTPGSTVVNKNSPLRLENVLYFGGRRFLRIVTLEEVTLDIAKHSPAKHRHESEESNVEDEVLTRPVFTLTQLKGILSLKLPGTETFRSLRTAISTL